MIETELTRDALLARLDGVERRLDRLARADFGQRRTAADGDTGEQWTAGQAWAHLAEFGEYWLGQITMVVECYGADPMPFGRLKTNAARAAAIERDRDRGAGVLLEKVRHDITAVRAFITGATEREWGAVGVHPKLGVMCVPGMVDEFIIAHYVQHSAQLDSVAANG